MSQVFIVGSSRSGTTLLQMILNSHPRLAIYGEVHYFDELRKLFGDKPVFCSKEEIDNFCDINLRRSYHARLLPKLDQVLERTKEKLYQLKASNEDIYRYMIESFAELENKSRCGEKTNEHIRYISDLLLLFPDAKIIHIVRDPRDVVSSMISMPWASDDILANSLRWRAEISNMQRHVHDTTHIYEIRYEDLIVNPEKICRGICDFIDESYSPAMLEYYKKSNKYVVNEPWKNKINSRLNGDAMLKWKRELSKWQAAAIQLLLGKLIRRYGYEEIHYSLFVHMAIPIILLNEFFKYIKYKRSQRKRRTEEGDSDVIYGDDKQLYLLLYDSFLKNT